MADEDQPGWAAPPPESHSSPPPAPPASPPPGWGQPPGWSQAPPPYAAAGAPVVQRRGKRWLVVLLAVLGVIIVVGVVGTVLFVDRTYPVVDTADDFLREIQFGSTEAATERLCAANRTGDSETAIEVVQATLRDSDSYTVNFLSVDRDGHRASIDFTVDYAFRDERSYRLDLRLEGSDWKVCPLPG